MAVTPSGVIKSEKYAVRTEIHGSRLGLDGNAFITGRDLKGIRIGTFEGSDYLLANGPAYNTVFDDFMGYALNAYQWGALKGSDGSCAYPVHVASASNGICRLASGAGAGGTVAVNGSQIVGALNMLVSNGGVVYESKVGTISSLANASTFIGLTDSNSLEAAFTRATTTTTAVATNGVGFLQDAASTNTHLYAVSVNAGGTPQSTALNIDLDTAANHVFRVEVDAAGNARFFVDGYLVATHLLAVATTSVFTPTVSIFTESANQRTIDVDYIYAQKIRV